MRKFKKPFHTSSPNWHSNLPKTKALLQFGDSKS